MIIKSEAIVLKTYDLRETSKIAIFFTKDFGRLKGVLKGIRKDPKKFSSSLDRFTVNDIVCYHYRHSELHLISQCDLKQFFFPVRQDYRRTLAANYVLELIDHIMPLEEKNLNVYQLIIQFLETLQDHKDIDKLIYMFQIKSLINSGFRPHLDSCIKCGRKVKPPVRFSSHLGGLLCHQCPTTQTNFISISPGTIATILHVEQNTWQKNLRLGLTAGVRKELKYILNNFLVYHLEKNLKSSKYL